MPYIPQIRLAPSALKHLLPHIQKGDDKLVKKSFRNEIKKREVPASELLLKAKSKKEQEDFETKTVRLNLLIKPSIKESIGKLATVDRISTNELVNRILQEYIKTRAQDVDRYDRFYVEK